MSRTFNQWNYSLATAWAANADLRFILLTTESAVPAAEDVALEYVDVFDPVTELGECAVEGYARVAADNVSVSKNDAELRIEITADSPISFAGLDGSGEAPSYVGLLAYDHVTDDSDSPIVAYIEFENGPLSGQASQIDIAIDPTGLLHIVGGDAV